jgi:hypothetical protein
MTAKAAFLIFYNVLSNSGKKELNLYEKKIPRNIEEIRLRMKKTETSCCVHEYLVTIYETLMGIRRQPNLPGILSCLMAVTG